MQVNNYPEQIIGSFFKGRELRRANLLRLGTLGSVLIAAVVIVLIPAFLILFITGCINGPVRYKTLGYQKYATAEMPAHTEGDFNKVLIAPVGLFTDAAVVIMDTVATPLTVVPIAFEMMGPCPQPTTRDNVVVKAVFSPIWYPISFVLYCGSMQFAKEPFYIEWFDKQGHIFNNADINTEPASNEQKRENRGQLQTGY